MTNVTFGGFFFLNKIKTFIYLRFKIKKKYMKIVHGFPLNNVFVGKRTGPCIFKL